MGDGTESWGLAAKWARCTWGLFGVGTLAMQGGEDGKERRAGEVGVGGTEAEDGRGWCVQGVDGTDLAVDEESGEDSGRGLDRVAWRGLGASLGLAGSVWVLLRAAGRGSKCGASELGVEMRRLARLGRGSGDWQGLALGECEKSGD